MQRQLITLMTVLSTISAVSAYAGEITKVTSKLENAEQTEVFYMVPPQKISAVQYSAEKNIQYMLDNYSLERMAQYAVRLNQAEIKAAEMQGTQIPAKLSPETLQSKDKIAQYLRSLYRYEY